MNSHFRQVAYQFLVKGTSGKYVGVQAGIQLMASDVIILKAALLHDSYHVPCG